MARVQTLLLDQKKLIKMAEMREELKILYNQIQTLDFWAFARWGVKSYVYDNEKYQLWLLVKGQHKQSKIIVAYDLGRDTYNIEYARTTRNHQWEQLKYVEDVYAEDLVQIIDDMMNNY